MHEHDIAPATAEHHGAHGAQSQVETSSLARMRPRHADGHGGHDKHAGHDPEMFRRRFWVSLLLTIPLVVTSEMVMDWFGYELDFAGMSWLGPVLGSIVFWWGGWPFLAGGVAELRDRQPGMMLLISMAITVAYAASMATSFDWLDLEFWWELAALVTIMLLGSLAGDEGDRAGPRRPRRAGGAVARRRRGGRRGRRPTRCASTSCASATSCLVRAGGRVPADGVIVEGEAELDESMITGESKPVAKGPGDRVVAGTVSTDSSIRVRVDGGRRRHGAGRDPAAGRRRPGERQPGSGVGRSLRRAAVLRGGRRGSRSRSSCGPCSATSTTPSCARSRCW